MKSTWPLWLMGALLAGIAIGAPARAEEIVVAAASSLTDVLGEIGKIYEARSGDTVIFNFGASSTLARQIEEGAPIDLLVSADVGTIERLEQSGRIEHGSSEALLSNRLVIVVPADSRLSVEGPADLLRDDIKKIALAEPSSVPVGIYARTYLEKEGVWSRLRSKVVPVSDARATLAAVESGNVDAGIVYKTDAAMSRRVMVAYEVPMGKGPEIVYAAAVINGSRKKRAARGLLDFLLTDAAKSSFKKYGFIVFE